MARVLKFVYSAEDQIELSEPCKQVEGKVPQQPGSPSHDSTENTSDCDLIVKVKEDVQEATNICKEKWDNCDLKKFRNQDKLPGKYKL